MKPSDAARQALLPLRQASALPPEVSYVPAGRSSTTYFWVEGTHFDSTFLTPQDLGKKILQVTVFQNLCRGLQTESVQLGLGVNASTSETFLQEMFRGVLAAAKPLRVRATFGLSVVSPSLFFCSAQSINRAGAKLSRAKPGDWVAVTGTLGLAAAGNAALRRFGWPALTDYPEATQAHLRPSPPTAFLLRARTLLTGVVSLNDGLASEAHRLAGAAARGIEISQPRLPIAAATRQLAGYMGMNAMQWALYGAEDYGILFSFAPTNKSKVEALAKKWRTPLTLVGKLTAGKDIVLEQENGEATLLLNRSWNPLVRSKSRA